MSDKKFYCARLYVTHKCNSACRYCDTHEFVYQKISDMKADRGKALISQLRDVGVKYIDFTGGEPTTNVDLPELLDFARELEIKTEVTTNAVAGLTPKMIQCALKARRLNISLDTLNSEKYRTIRGVDKLDTVKATASAIVALRKSAHLSLPRLMTVVSNDNLEELPELIAFARELGVQVYFNPVFHYGGKFGSAIDTRLLDRLRGYTFSPNAVVPIHWLEFISDSYKNDITHPPRCAANRQILTFVADGRLISPCYHAHPRTLLPIGDNLHDFLSSELFDQQALLTEKLPSCEHCKVAPYFGISFSYKPDKYFLLQSFSDRLGHLKSDFGKHLSQEHSPELLKALDKFLAIVSSLPACQDFHATNCWELEDMPHQLFDKIYSSAFKELRPNSDATLINLIPEFMLRLWITIIVRKMHSTYIHDVSEDISWIKNYLKTVGFHCEAMALNL